MMKMLTRPQNCYRLSLGLAVMLLDRTECIGTICNWSEVAIWLLLGKYSTKADRTTIHDKLSICIRIVKSHYLCTSEPFLQGFECVLLCTSPKEPFPFLGEQLQGRSDGRVIFDVLVANGMHFSRLTLRPASSKRASTVAR